MIQRVDWIIMLAGSMRREDFAQDLRTQLAVQAGFAQLGEASLRVSDHTREAHQEIEWRSIRHFRNFMIHVYDQIDPDKLFDTIQQDLRPLRAKLWGLLSPGEHAPSLYGRVDWILAAKWDPIGVAPLEHEAVRDEYREYVSHLVSEGERGGLDALVARLGLYRTQWMTLPADEQQDRIVAELILKEIGRD